MNPNSANPAIDKRSLLEQGLGAYQEVWSIVRRHNGRIVFLLIFGVLLASAYCRGWMDPGMTPPSNCL